MISVKFIFGNPDNRQWTLSLYNAINGSNHQNPGYCSAYCIQ